MKLSKEAMRLYAVTDRSWLNGQELADQVEEALRGGVTFVQLREKGIDTAAFVLEARRIGALCRRYHVPFVVNDDIEAALEADADGVHVGQSDIAAGKARQLLGAQKILGVSAHTVEEALFAVQSGADYLGVGAMFPTSSKADASAVSLDTLRAIRAAVTVPIVAIGGISEGNLLSLRGSGADGVAVISAIFAAQDIRAAASRLRALADELPK